MNNIKQLKTDFDNLIIEKNYCLSDPEVVSKAIELENILNNTLKKSQTLLICTPKVRHFWRCIFLWQRKGKNIENTRQNSNYLL